MNRNYRILGTVAVLICMFLPVVAQSQFMPGGMNAGPCTNLGCMKLEMMWSPGPDDTTTEDDYCLSIINGEVGRYVRNRAGKQGGSPCAQQGTQPAWKAMGATLRDCKACQPPPGYASHGGVGGFVGLQISFGNYGCKAGKGQPCL